MSKIMAIHFLYSVSLQNDFISSFEHNMHTTLHEVLSSIRKELAATPD